MTTLDPLQVIMRLILPSGKTASCNIDRSILTDINNPYFNKQLGIGCEGYSWKDSGRVVINFAEIMKGVDCSDQKAIEILKRYIVIVKFWQYIQREGFSSYYDFAEDLRKRYQTPDGEKSEFYQREMAKMCRDPTFSCGREYMLDTWDNVDDRYQLLLCLPDQICNMCLSNAEHKIMENHANIIESLKYKEVELERSRLALTIDGPLLILVDYISDIERLLPLGIDIIDYNSCATVNHLLSDQIKTHIFTLYVDQTNVSPSFPRTIEFFNRCPAMANLIFTTAQREILAVALNVPNRRFAGFKKSTTVDDLIKYLKSLECSLATEIPDDPRLKDIDDRYRFLSSLLRRRSSNSRHVRGSSYNILDLKTSWKDAYNKLSNSEINTVMTNLDGEYRLILNRYEKRPAK